MFFEERRDEILRLGTRERHSGNACQYPDKRERVRTVGQNERLQRLQRRAHARELSIVYVRILVRRAKVYNDIRRLALLLRLAVV